MAECPFCKADIKHWNRPHNAYLILSKSNIEDHIHVHGTIEKKKEIKELIESAIIEVGLSEEFAADKKKGVVPSEVVFKNRQRIGDILMFTCGIRDFKRAFPDTRVNVMSTCMHIWDNNPYVDNTVEIKKDKIIDIGPGKLTNMSNRIDWHFANAFRMSMENALGVTIPQGISRPDVWLTEEEYHAEPVTKQPYWLIVVGGEKSWGCKMFPFEKWQEFVNQNPDTLFYQLGAREDRHPILQGNNVVNYIGKTQDKHTGIRDLFKLFLNAEGSIGLVSFHMHLSAAFNKPCIVVAGAREPVSFTRYYGHQYLTTEGCLPCSSGNACWHCNINSCSHLIEYDGNIENKVPQCVDIIQPEDLTRALNMYYIGGRLKKGVQSPKMKFANVVKEQKIFTKPERSRDTKYGIRFGANSFELGDWDLISDIIAEYNVKSILEFGSGLSTLLFNEKNMKVISYEDKQPYIDEIKLKNNKCDVRLWDRKSIDTDEHFDLAFVDGPLGGINREHSIRIASELAKIVIIHDAGRKEEQMWQQKYMVDKFEMFDRKARSRAWKLKSSKPAITGNTTTPTLTVKKDADTKFVKFVSTARGWGGCARSITTIMKHMIDRGHKVEFIPFRNRVGSREFREALSSYLKDVVVTENYDTLNEHCDVLLMYADDYIWEFGKPEIVDAFSNLNADRKVMMLNYRQGNVGVIPWTKHWDKYMFLNSTQEKNFLSVHPNVNTKIMPPCTDLKSFFNVTPNYNNNLRVVRHSSQGDTKYDKYSFDGEVSSILECREDCEIRLMPAPSFVGNYDRLIKHGKNKPSVPEFLAMGNLFWYSLPVGYYDMGPRAIIEAMAVGLPILADNWGGVVDRVGSNTNSNRSDIEEYDCGWLVGDKNSYVDIIKNVTFEELRKKGNRARERAREFVPDRWVDEVIYE